MKTLLEKIYRVRIPLLGASAIGVIVFTTAMTRLSPGPLTTASLALYLMSVLGLVTAGGLALFGARLVPISSQRTVHAPVAGRWRALNSPASKVPSHGIRAYGQSHAIDLVLEPPDLSDQVRPEFGSGAGMRPATDFPAFGAPVLAMVDGTVVAASDRQRDHRSRSRLWAVGYMMLAGTARELGGPRFVVGNQITIRTDDGVYALVAHLRQHSALVKVGDRVAAGQRIAQCGNTGNSSEPHVHAQLMDRISLWTAQGIPMAFADITVESLAGATTGLPQNNELLVTTNAEQHER